MAPVRVLIIGAGSRGTAYAEGTSEATNCVIAAVAEPVRYKREVFGGRFIWGGDGGKKEGEGQEFEGWREWVEYGMFWTFFFLFLFLLLLGGFFGVWLLLFGST